MEKSLFSNPAEIEAEYLDGLEVLNQKEAVDEALQRWDWNGRPAGCAVLKLSPDNNGVVGAQFVTRGRLTKEVFTIEAAKLWSTANQAATLTVHIPTADIFTFSQGGLTSDFVGMNAVEHSVTSNGSTIPTNNYPENGIGQFSLRLVASLQKATVKAGVILRFTVLIYPATGADMLDRSSLAKNPGWPGFKLMEGEMTLLPRPPTPWGCPVLPLLQTGAPWGTETTAPPAEELRDRVAWLMATSEPPDHCKSLKALTARWDYLSSHPGDYTAKRSAITWPKPQLRRVQGRNYYSNY